MPLVTGKLSWRSSSPNKAMQAFVITIRNFIVNSGNYTLIADQTTSTTDPYFVVRSNRETGFSGDKIVAKIGATLGTNSGAATYLRSSPYFMFYNYAFESWSGTTGTNQTATSSGTHANTFMNTSIDCDFWISCDETHILSMSRIYDSSYTASSPCGVVNFERLPGDNDPGTFYGNFTFDCWNSSRRIFVPRRWDSTTGTSAVFSVISRVGNINSENSIGLFGVNESDKHAVLGLNVCLPSFNKIKGKIYGVGVSTFGFDLAHGTLIPDAEVPQYIVGKPCDSGNVSASSICMQAASTIVKLQTYTDNALDSVSATDSLTYFVYNQPITDSLVGTAKVGRTVIME